MKGKVMRRSVIALLVMPWLSGCFSNAERDSPLDPKSPTYRARGNVRGTVTRWFSPFEPIEGAEVRLLPANWATFTDARGEFMFPDAPAGAFVLRAAKLGYAPDSTAVEVQVGQETQKTLRLDALPVFQETTVISSHISRWWPPDDLFVAQFRAKAYDPDGQPLSVVWVAIPSLGVIDTLLFSSVTKQFEGNLNQETLPNRNLQSLLGREIIFRARDGQGKENTTTGYLARIILDTPVAASPQGLQTFVPPDTLRWQPLFLPFDFTYAVEVVRVDVGIPTVVWSRGGIATSDTFTVIPPAAGLVTGTYFWTVAVVDEFGNRSRSKEASFRVP